MNWEYWEYLAWAVVATVVVLLVGGFYWKLKADIKKFVRVIVEAHKDGNIDDSEWAEIIKAGKDAGKTLREITFAVLQLLARK